jgi:hypothetical protein
MGKALGVFPGNNKYKEIMDAHSKHHIPLVTGAQSGFSIDDICPWCNRDTVGFRYFSHHIHTQPGLC